MLAGGQVVQIPYKIVITPPNGCDYGIYAGQSGYVSVSPGIPGTKDFDVNYECDLCPLPFTSDGAAMLILNGGNLDCMELTASAGYMWNSNLTFYAACDGEPDFTLTVSLGRYAGSIKDDACGGCLPADTNKTANVWYVPPGTNTPGGLSLPGPLTWSLPVNPCNATIISNGWYAAVVRAGTNPGSIKIRATGTNGCFVESWLDIGNCDSGCSGNCTTGGPEMGDGEMELSSIDGRFYLGKTSEGKSAGFLRTHIVTPSLNAYKKAYALVYPFHADDVEVIPFNYNPNDIDTPLQQIKTPQGLVTITDVSAGYDVKFFALSNVGTFTTNGGYAHDTNSHYVLWQVRNPDNVSASNRLNVTKMPIGESSTTWRYEWTQEDGLYLTKPDGSIHQLLQSAGREERITYSTNSDWIRYAATYYTTNTVNGPFTYEIRGVGPDARTNSYSYYSNGLLQQVVREDGSWEYYHYDEQRRPLQIFSAFGK